MSRIGKKPIALNEQIKITLDNQNIIIEGPKGKLNYTAPKSIKIQHNKQHLFIQKHNNQKETKALYGLSRTIINNMVIGVSEGFYKKLEIKGVGYKAQVDNNNHLILNVGYSHPVKIETPKDIKITVENNIQITITGIDKEQIGQLAAHIRSIKPPEPYKGKGIRYSNEIIRKKVGKAGK